MKQAVPVGPLRRARGVGQILNFAGRSSLAADKVALSPAESRFALPVSGRAWWDANCFPVLHDHQAGSRHQREAFRPLPRAAQGRERAHWVNTRASLEFLASHDLGDRITRKRLQG